MSSFASCCSFLPDVNDDFPDNPDYDYDDDPALDHFDDLDPLEYDGIDAMTFDALAAEARRLTQVVKDALQSIEETPYFLPHLRLVSDIRRHSKRIDTELKTRQAFHPPSTKSQQRKYQYAKDASGELWAAAAHAETIMSISGYSFVSRWNSRFPGELVTWNPETGIQRTPPLPSTLRAQELADEKLLRLQSESRFTSAPSSVVHLHCQGRPGLYLAAIFAPMPCLHLLLGFAERSVCLVCPADMDTVFDWSLKNNKRAFTGSRQRFSQLGFGAILHSLESKRSSFSRFSSLLFFSLFSTFSTFSPFFPTNLEISSFRVSFSLFPTKHITKRIKQHKHSLSFPFLFVLLVVVFGDYGTPLSLFDDYD